MLCFHWKDTCINDLGSMPPRLTFPSSAAVGIISYCDIGEALMKEFHKVVLFSGAGAISTQLCFFPQLRQLRIIVCLIIFEWLTFQVSDFSQNTLFELLAVLFWSNSLQSRTIEDQFFVFYLSGDLQVGMGRELHRDMGSPWPPQNPKKFSIIRNIYLF